MKNSYNQQIESFLNFYNSVYYQALGSGYTLLFAGEFKDIRNEMDENEKVEIEPDLLVLSNDKIVQILGKLCKELEPKIEELSNLNNIELETCTDIVDEIKNEIKENSTYDEERHSFKNQDYKKVFFKCSGTFLEFSFDMVSIMDAFISNEAGVKPAEMDAMTPMAARIESLRPYCDTNTSLLLDMTLSLTNAAGDLMHEGTSNGLLKDMTLGDLLAIANEPN